jgi:hypothetical protein
MTLKAEITSYSVQPMGLDATALYSIDTAAHLAGMPRHVVLVCCKNRFVMPRLDPALDGYWFDAAAVRQLQRIEYLRTECGVNFTGIRIILDLMDEVERLRETRAL